MLNVKDNKKVISVTLGVLLVTFGLLIIFSDYIKEKKNRAFEIVNLELYNLEEKNDYGEVENDELEDIEKEEEVPDEEPSVEPPSIVEPPQQEPIIQEPAYYYIGLLEIPKIGLKKGFVDPSSPYNHVDANITIIPTSTFPDIDKGNFILAAHSGTGYISYFKNLYKLVVGDYAYIYYNNIKYTYKIVDIYKEPKTGSVAIYRDYNQTVLTLITCTKNDESTQTIYIANLIDKTNY